RRSARCGRRARPECGSTASPVPTSRPPSERRGSGMSTSAEFSFSPSSSPSSPALLRALPYDDPVAQYLVEQVQLEYVDRYGGRDGAVVDPAEFVPPRGLFLVAE